MEGKPPGMPRLLRLFRLLRLLTYFSCPLEPVLAPIAFDGWHPSHGSDWPLFQASDNQHCSVKRGYNGISMTARRFAKHRAMEC
jgi:hypothetical protein